MARCKWSQEDDLLLREAVGKYGPRNWKQIAETLKNGGNIIRSDVQCSQRWLKVLQPGLKKGAWQTDEDQKLRQLVMRERDTQSANAFCSSQHNLKLDWVLISQQIPGRTSKSVRERWLRYLDPCIKKDAWTPAEDRILLEKEAQIGHKWAAIARLEVLQGRTGEAVKMRWKQLMKENKNSSNSSNGSKVATPSKLFATPARPVATKREMPSPVALAVGSIDHTCEQRANKRPRLGSCTTVVKSTGGQEFRSAHPPATPSMTAESILDEWMTTDLTGEIDSMTQAIINETDEDNTDVDSLNGSESSLNVSNDSIDGINAETPRDSECIDSSTALNVLSEMGSLLDLADFRTGTTPRSKMLNRSHSQRLTRSSSLVLSACVSSTGVIHL